MTSTQVEGESMEALEIFLLTSAAKSCRVSVEDLLLGADLQCIRSFVGKKSILLIGGGRSEGGHSLEASSRGC